MFGEMDADGGPVFEGAKLFEAFGLFERRRGEGDKALEEVNAVAVDAKVAVGRKGGDVAATIGDGGAGKVESGVEAVEGEFDDVGIGNEFGVIEWTPGGDHGEGLILAEGAGEGIDEGRFEEGFVALDIDDVGGGLALFGRFGDAVGAGGVIGTGANGTGSDGVAEGGDAVVVGGDDEFIEFLAEGDAFENVLEEGLAKKGVAGLSGEAGRGPAGRNDSNDSCFFVANNNPP